MAESQAEAARSILASMRRMHTRQPYGYRLAAPAQARLRPPGAAVTVFPAHLRLKGARAVPVICMAANRISGIRLGESAGTPVASWAPLAPRLCHCGFSRACVFFMDSPS